MSMQRDQHNDDSADERDSSLPVLRGWWSELSPAAKLLIPTSAVVLAFVAASAVPPLVF